MISFSQIQSLSEQIVEKFQPDRIVLFGTDADDIIKKGLVLDELITREWVS